VATGTAIFQSHFAVIKIILTEIVRNKAEFRLCSQPCELLKAHKGI
jgi:hypothetical protein